ncbi:hypothetical protein Ocin01_15501, partial [Orchesella cincta]
RSPPDDLVTQDDVKPSVLRGLETPPQVHLSPKASTPTQSQYQEVADVLKENEVEATELTDRDPTPTNSPDVLRRQLSSSDDKIASLEDKLEEKENEGKAEQKVILELRANLRKAEQKIRRMTVALANSDDEFNNDERREPVVGTGPIKTEEGLENVRFARDDEVHTANDARLNTEDKEIIEITLSDDDHDEGPVKRIKLEEPAIDNFMEVIEEENNDEEDMNSELDFNSLLDVSIEESSSKPQLTFLPDYLIIAEGSLNARNVDKSSLFGAFIKPIWKGSIKQPFQEASLDAVCVDDILRPELAFMNIVMSFIQTLIQPVDSVILVFTHIPSSI